MDADMDSVVNSALTYTWDKQSEWSQAGTKAKKSLFQLRYAALGLTVLAAVLATLAIQLGGLSSAAERILAALATLALGLLALLQSAIKPEKILAWTRARSVAEALKAVTFTFLAGVAPYRGNDRAEKLLQNVNAVLTDAADLSVLTVGIAAKQRQLPAVNDIASYTALRVDQQINEYYKPQSATMLKRATQFRRIQVGLSIAGLLLSFASTVSGQQGFLLWAPVIATIIAAVAAHSAVQRYAALSEEYARTYDQLQRIKLTHQRTSDTDPAAAQNADDDFVAEAERVISIQNESWMARSIAAGESDSANRAGTADAQGPS
jgi:SMODS and SLOG-associating 2TM effector domain 1/Protein of unknown function (DUF4231)